MHIAYFAPSWASPQFPNGIVTYVRSMRDELSDRGHHVSVVAGAIGNAESGVFGVRTPKVQRMQAWLKGKVGSPLEPIFQGGEAIAATALEIHRRRPIDILEMEESFGWFATVARRSPFPIVVKLHGPAFLSLVDEELETTLSKAKIVREGEALRQATFLTSPAAHTLEVTEQRYALSPALRRRIVNPVVMPDSTPMWSLPACEPRRLLFVGRFDKRKGGDIVLLAFRRLLDRHPDLQLTFVGPDVGIADDTGVVKNFAAFSSELFGDRYAANLDFRGRLAAAEIPALRPRALATIVASRWENQSYTLLEAMLQGCPVVSSDAGGQGEIIQHGRNGLLAAAGDPEALAAQLQVLLDQPPYAAQLGREARTTALSLHSPAVVADETLAFYQEALALQRSASRAGRG